MHPPGFGLARTGGVRIQEPTQPAEPEHAGLKLRSRKLHIEVVKGPDAGRFLDMMYTGMMSTLPVGKCRYGLMCSENGFLIDDGETPRNVRVAEAPSHGQSIVGYDRASRGGVAYLGLAGEVMRRQREREVASKKQAREEAA